MQTPWIFEYLKLYRFFQMGHLPADGGLINQSAVLVDAFELIGKYGRK